MDKHVQYFYWLPDNTISRVKPIHDSVASVTPSQQMPPRRLPLKSWLESKYGEAIPASCIEAYFLNDPNLLPTSLRNSYFRKFPYAIPLVTPGSALLEIVNEYKEDGTQKIELQKSAAEPNILDAALSLSVVEALLTSMTFFPDFDNISKDVIEDLMMPDSKENFRKNMKQYGFDEDWDEVIDLLSPVGLLTAYLRMCCITIEIDQPGDPGANMMRFGDVFRCDDDSYLSRIPIVIFKYYNISPLVANALLDRSLAEFVMQEAGIEFLYGYAPDR
jgi:hypothetical protein